MNRFGASLVDVESLAGASGVTFSICTLVTRPEQYDDMVSSFKAKGFCGDDCEFIYQDNSQGNGRDAYSAVNLFLRSARGKYIILCHQDVLLLEDGRAELEAALENLTGAEPHWGVCGNAGGVALGRLAIRISDPHGQDQHTEVLPARVDSLDENFLVVRRGANLALSRDLSGFHMYGTDICIVADVLGWTAHVVDFHLRHLSGGVRDQSLIDSRSALAEKYARSFRSRWVTTPCEIVYLSGTPLASGFLNSGLIVRVFRRFLRAIAGVRRNGARKDG